MSVITGYSDVFGPRFFLEANGSLASDIIPYVTKFTYEDDEHKTDEMKLIIANPGLKFKDDPRFKEGARFRVRFGYLSDISDVKNAVIAKAKPHYPASGIPTIEMVAFGLQLDLNKKANPGHYGAVSSAEVARVIAKRYGFDMDIEESNDARDQIRYQPISVTDIQYLKTLAHPLNWDCYIEGTTLHFHHKRYEATPTLEFVYYTDERGTLLDFEPEVKMNAPPATGVTGSNAKDGKSATGGRMDDPGNQGQRRLLDTNNTKVGALVPGKGGPHAFAGASGTHSATPEGHAKVVALHGAGHAQRIDMSAIKAKGSVVGTPRVRARQMIRISGVDKQYTGAWRVTKSTHTIDAKGKVYVVSIQLSRDAGKSAKDMNKSAADGSGGNGKAVNRVKVLTNQGRVTGAFSQ